MATARDICSRALRKAGVVGHGETSPAENMSAAVEDLNMMLAAWKLASVDITHVALAENSTFPIADEYEEGAVHMLAGRIAPDYRFPVGFDADAFFRKIQAAYYTEPTMTQPSALLHMPSRSARDGDMPLDH